FGSTRVTLKTYVLHSFGALNLDRVGAYNDVPDGQPDHIGQFKVEVSTGSTSLSQGDPDWARLTYNNYNDAVSRSDPGAVCRIGDDKSCCRIQRLGCALTTLAMALRFAGATTI